MSLPDVFWVVVDQGRFGGVTVDTLLTRPRGCSEHSGWGEGDPGERGVTQGRGEEKTGRRAPVADEYVCGGKRWDWSWASPGVIHRILRRDG